MDLWTRPLSAKAEMHGRSPPHAGSAHSRLSNTRRLALSRSLAAGLQGRISEVQPDCQLQQSAFNIPLLNSQIFNNLCLIVMSASYPCCDWQETECWGTALPENLTHKTGGHPCGWRHQGTEDLYSNWWLDQYALHWRRNAEYGYRKSPFVSPCGWAFFY